MQHPGREWYEKSAIYEEVAWNVVPLQRLAERWEFQRFLAQGFPAGAFVFDVGCGRGDFLALARARGYEVGGTDPNRRLLAIAASSFGLHGLACTPLESIALESLPRRPDVLTAFEVLEHLPDPAAFLGACRRLLGRGGALFLSVPGVERWPRLFNRVVDAPPHHLTLWTPAALHALLEGHGFEVREVTAKPLSPSDLTYHAVRAMPGALAAGPGPKLLRGLCKAACLGVTPFLRCHPRAGGFTLVALAVVR